MADLEVLGRLFFRPVKHKLQDEQNSVLQHKPQVLEDLPAITDMKYERDQSDWWWCEDL